MQQPVTSAEIDDVEMDDIQSINAFLKRYPDIADEARLRWWLFNRRTNGLEKSSAVIKRAGRWYVLVPRFKSWLLDSSAGSRRVDK